MGLICVSLSSLELRFSNSSSTIRETETRREFRVVGFLRLFFFWFLVGPVEGAVRYEKRIEGKEVAKSVDFL
jgi:hypothetical protein